MSTGKAVATSSAAVGGFATAEESGVVIQKLDNVASAIHNLTPQTEMYVSKFDLIWIAGMDGNDTVRFAGLVVLILSGMVAALNVRKLLKET